MSDPGCYRHAGRPTAIACQRCERPICPDCMVEAAVGFHCPDCVKAGRARVRQPRTVAGGAVTAKVGLWSTTIIAVNVAVFLIVESTGGPMRSAVFIEGAMIADTVSIRQTGNVTTGFLDGAWWRPVTGGFLHSGLAHLALNMLAVFIFGRLLEQWLGTVRFLSAYLVSILGASLAVLWLSPGHALTVGASGAVFGLFAIALVMLIRMRQDVRFLLALLAINIGFSFTGGISWQAHLGGFVTGAVLGLVFAYAPRARRTAVHATAVIALGGAIAALLYLPLL